MLPKGSLHLAYLMSFHLLAWLEQYVDAARKINTTSTLRTIYFNPSPVIALRIKQRCLMHRGGINIIGAFK